MVASLDDIIKQQARGKMVARIATTGAPGTVTAGNQSCGFFTMSLAANTLSTTYPNTLESLEGPAGISSDMQLFTFGGLTSSSRTSFLARLYRVGTLALTGTIPFDGFTHDAATFPLLRDEMGQSNRPQALIPVIRITTTTGGSAAQFRLRTSAGGAGYVNQDGVSVVGSKMCILPGAITQAQSMFFLPLNDGDWGCRDITQISVSINATAGAATIYLMEILALVPANLLGAYPTDTIGSVGLDVANSAPAVATSGTASSTVGMIALNASQVATNLVNIGVLP